MQLLLLLVISVFASEKKETRGNSEPKILEHSAQNSILVKIEEDEYVKKHTSHYFGVRYHKQNENWRAERWSKKEKKKIYNGSYKYEETAGHASDTLARKLIANGEKDHKLNFPDDDTEVCPNSEKENYFGVTYNMQRETWSAWRWSKNENKQVRNGTYKNEETAAHASDTLARNLIANGEKNHKLNFPDDASEVYPKKLSQYIGVYNKKDAAWRTSRWSTNEKKTTSNGIYKDEETAAHASDTLARALIDNGEKGHKLNFPDDNTEVYPKIQNNKRKRPADFNNSQKYE